MKIRILFAALLVAAFATAGFSQRPGKFELRRVQVSGVVLDTFTNSQTKYFTLPYEFVDGSSYEISWQFNVTKISGTVAGAITLEASIDGNTWAAVDVDSLTAAHTVTDATASYIWSKFGTGHTKYRAKIATTGTQVSSVSSYAYIRRR